MSKVKLYICRIRITLFSDLSRVPERLTASFLFNRSDVRNPAGISGNIWEYLSSIVYLCKQSMPTRPDSVHFGLSPKSAQFYENGSVSLVGRWSKSLLTPANVPVLLLRISRKKQQMRDLRRKQAVRQMEDRSVSFPSCTRTHR